MKKDLFAPIRSLLSLSSRKELPYLCLLNEEAPIRSLRTSYLYLPVRSSLIFAFLMKRDLFAPIRNLLSLPSHKELPYLCLLNEEGPIRSH